MIQFIKNQTLEKFHGKKCLLRIDLNIENPKSDLDLYRLKSVIPTINMLLKHDIKVILLSHRGRPKNKEKKLSLKPFTPIFEHNLRTKVMFIPNFDWTEIKNTIEKSENKVFLLENLRFLKGEEENDKSLAKKLASLGDFYVNDAFAVSHRKNTSIVAITNFLPAFGGLLMEREIKSLDNVLSNFKHPFLVIIGGAKIKDKLGVIENFSNKADYFLLGGGPANTFLKKEGMDIGKSLFDEESIKNITKYLNEAKIILPDDYKMKNLRILDIGPKTVKIYNHFIQKASTIIWNGPMGLFEKKGFEKGTSGIWKAILKNKKAKVVIGGGETIASLKIIPKSQRLKILKAKNIFLSTGGGAMLEYLSGKKLPGIEAIKNNKLM
jgi:phosphoglycerate kinase